MLNSLHIFERWEILCRDFLGSGRISSTFTGIFLALKPETKSLCRLFPEDRARAVAEESQKDAELCKNSIENRSHCSALLKP